jgi:hypothetical protein
LKIETFSLARQHDRTAIAAAFDESIPADENQ